MPLSSLREDCAAVAWMSSACRSSRAKSMPRKAMVTKAETTRMIRPERLHTLTFTAAPPGCSCGATRARCAASDAEATGCVSCSLAKARFACSRRHFVLLIAAARHEASPASHGAYTSAAVRSPAHMGIAMALATDSRCSSISSRQRGAARGRARARARARGGRPITAHFSCYLYLEYMAALL